MFVMELKSLRLYVTLFLVLVVPLCGAGAEVKGSAKKGPSDKKDSLDLPTDSLSPEDVTKVENTTVEEDESKKVFLTPKEGCDFLGMGPLFDRPDYHKDLLHDYQTMEQFGYWEMRCEEIDLKNAEKQAVLDTQEVPEAPDEKPSYCT